MMPYNSSKSVAEAQPAASFADRLRAHQEAQSGKRSQLGELLAFTASPPAQSPAGAMVLAGPKPSDIALAFLKLLDPAGRHNLVSIEPENGRIEGRTFAPGAWEEMAPWIDERESRCNLYFSVNEPSSDAPHAKLSKSAITAIRALHVDIDPTDDPAGSLTSRQAHAEAERKRLRALVDALNNGAIPPSVSIDSGGGVQLLWFLEKLDATEWCAAVEAQNYGIAEALSGDVPTRDIARILRLPGTMNLPNAGKRAKGRIARRASVIYRRDASYRLAEIAVQYAPVSRVENKDHDPEIRRLMGEIGMHAVSQAGSYEELPADLRFRFEAARAENVKLRDLWETGVPVGKDTTASAARFDLGRLLKAGGNFTPDEFGTLLWVWEHTTSPGKPEIAEWHDFDLRREIARCWIKSGNPTPEKNPAVWFDVLDTGEIRGNNKHEGSGPLDIFGDADPGDLADLPADALPRKLTRWVRSEARRKGVPEAFAAASAVVVLGATIGADIRVQVRQRDDAWTEAANLWAVIVAPPGSAKSPTIAAAVAPLRKVDQRWVDVDAAEYAAWEAASKKRGRDAPPAGPAPPIRRAVVDDITPEKSVRVFRDNPRGVLQAPDELAGLLGGLGQYKSGGGADRTHFLRSFDGDSIVNDRVGSGTITAKRAQLAVLAGTQPEKMRKIAHDLGSDGLLQRFIVILHDGQERRALDEEPDREAARWFATTVERLANANYFTPEPVRFSADAHRVLAEITREIDALKHIPGASDALKGHLEKWGKLLPRLALIVHVASALDQAEDFDPCAEIERATAAMTVRLARLFLRHALAFYTEYFERSGPASDAVWIAGWILTHPDKRTITRRDLGDARKDLRSPEKRRALLAAMGELESAGWCAVQKRDHDGPTAWSVDQRVHDRFAARAQRERAERAIKREKIAEAGAARKRLSGGADILAFPRQVVGEGIFG